MSNLHILYDGWPLLREPADPAALHLLALLANLPASVQATVALPAAPPPWLPANLALHSHQAADTPGARLAWEQRTLPNLARKLQADLLHLTSAHPALIGQPRCAVSPSGYTEDGKASGGLIDRLRIALAQGGMARLRGLLWPDDLPGPEHPSPVHLLPAVVHPDFALPSLSAASRLADRELPENYILYHGPYRTRELVRLLNAWSWPAGPIGELYPLVLLGAPSEAREYLMSTISRQHLDGTVIVLPDIAPDQIPAVYRGCSALFHPAPISPWGGAVRHALACGKPVVAAASERSDALVGPAAYLVPGDDTRALGAALITIVVETDVAASLSQAATDRAAGWQSEAFGERLLAVYRAITAA